MRIPFGYIKADVNNIVGTVTITGDLILNGDAYLYGTSTVEIADATPVLDFKDTSCTDSDINAQISVNATATGTGAENVDVTFMQQVAGNPYNFMVADADGNLTLQSSVSDVVINDDLTVNNTITGHSTITISHATPVFQFKDTDCTDADVNASIAVNATATGTGAEDIDVTLMQQVAGAAHNFLIADADGGLSLVAQSPGGNAAQRLVYVDGLATVVGPRTPIGTATGFSSAGTATLSKATHGLTVAAGQLLVVTECTTAADRGQLYRVVSSTAGTIVVDRALAGTETGTVSIEVYGDVVMIVPGTATAGPWISGKSTINAPLQIGGDNYIVTTGVDAGDLLIGGDTFIPERIAIGGGPLFALQIHGASFSANLSSISESLTDLTSAWVSHSDTANVAPLMYFARSKGTYAGQTAVVDGNTLGQLIFAGHDGTDFNHSSAIVAYVDGTPAADGMPGALSFQTSPVGSNTLAEHFRVSNDGASAFTCDEITTGDALSLSADALTTGSGLFLESTSTAGGASGSSYVQRIVRSGAQVAASHTAYGVHSSVTATGTTNTNVAGYFSASGGSTDNQALHIGAGSIAGAANMTMVFESNQASGTTAFQFNAVNAYAAGNVLAIYEDTGSSPAILFRVDHEGEVYCKADAVISTYLNLGSLTGTLYGMWMGTTQDVAVVPSSAGGNFIAACTTNNAFLAGTKERTGALTGCISNGTATITKVGHGLTPATGSLAHTIDATTSADEGFRRVVSYTVDTITFDRAYTGSDSDVDIRFYEDVVATLGTDGTNGQMIASFSAQNKPLQLGGSTYVATTGLTGEDVTVAGVLNVDVSAASVGVGLTPTANMAGVAIEAGVLTIKETTTPTADANYAKIYSKTDNKAYFQDGAGTEHTISFTDDHYGEMYLNANGNPTTIETANTPIALREFTAGDVSGFTFDAGSTAAITAYADYSGTVAGTVLATSAHGLTTGDWISIRGTTNYNGIFQITVVDGTHFYFTDTWVADDGASDFDEPSHLVAGTGTAGEYSLSWDMSSNEGGGAGSTFTFVAYINGTAQPSPTVQRKFANNDVGAYGGCGILTVADGDWIYLTASSDGVNTITNAYGAMMLSGL
jgi:hypothetical protein